MAVSPVDASIDMSFVRGGPADRLLRLAGLEPGVTRKAVVLAALTWIPLLALSMAQGVAIGDRVSLPLLLDLSAYARFLVAVPLFLVAELPAGGRIADAIRQFVTAGIVPERQQPAFEAALARAARLRNAWLPEAAFLAIAYAAAWLNIQQGVHTGTSSWIAPGTPPRPSWAGMWFALVSVPIYQFLAVRWLWRLILWTGFLARVAKLELELLPTAADRAGGLGFLAETQLGFAPLVSALSVVFSAHMALAIRHGGWTVAGLQPVMVAFLLMVAVIFLGPLVAFVPVLVRARLRGLLEYGRLAMGYSRSFDRKWLRDEAPEGETLLGSSDIQSLSDIGGSYSIIVQMRVIPTEVRHLVAMEVLAILSMLPALSTVIPLRNILEKLISILVR